MLSNNTPAQIGLLKRQLDEKDAQMKEMEVELLLVKDQLNRLRETLKCPIGTKWDHGLPSSVPTSRRSVEHFSKSASLQSQGTVNTSH